jgi:hypothetical protein
VRAATGFHHNLAGCKLNKKAEKLGAREPLTLRDTPVLTGHGQLEDIFCQVNRNDRSIHIGLLLVGAFAETPHMLSLAH